jgi:D-sedoheptulose 7-phosphate isomerase
MKMTGNTSNKMNEKKIDKIIISSSDLISNLTYLTPEIRKVIGKIATCLNNGKKIILFGNGGSAADAQHIAAELIGKFKLKRQSYPALALTSNTSIITAISNDFSFTSSFSRQCESLVSNNDVVVGISTSGKSTNVRKALLVSKKKGAYTIGLLGNGGGSIKKIVDASLVVESNSTPRIQEAHRVIYHIICEQVEEILEKSN